MRWLLLPLGLVVVGLAAWLLLSTPAPEVPTREAAPPVAAPPGPGPRLPGREAPSEPDAAPMGHIDPVSRAQLEAVLEREGIGP